MRKSSGDRGNRREREGKEPRKGAVSGHDLWRGAAVGSCGGLWRVNCPGFRGAGLPHPVPSTAAEAFGVSASKRSGTHGSLCKLMK